MKIPENKETKADTKKLSQKKKIWSNQTYFFAFKGSNYHPSFVGISVTESSH